MCSYIFFLFHVVRKYATKKRLRNSDTITILIVVFITLYKLFDD